ncbi:MAG: accessory gene regulator B family protein [Butyrivibrio sp.]|nr:accessory gene regulator B family protein [Butyrivibrio sp.]
MSNYSDEEIEVAVYGLKHLGMFLISMVVVAVIGLLMGNVHGIFLFLLLFIPLRIFAGGLHLPTLWMCAIASSALIVAVGFILNNTKGSWINEIIFSMILCAGAFLVIALSPVDTANKRLFNEEKVRYKIVSSIITIVELGIFFFCQDNDFLQIIIFLVITVEAFYLTVQEIVNCISEKKSKCEQ